MAQVRIERGCVFIDGRRVPLVSGSVHFWRLDRGSWGPVLDAVADLGLEVIDTYVAWEFHETEPDVFDFQGSTDPRRNLDGFLRLAREQGLWVIIRPGPYIYAEWPNMGVPTDVAAYHRAHPRFRERAAAYIAAVASVIAPHQATRDGSVVLLQPDNEVDPFEYCYEEQLGLDRTEGLFHQFLRRRYPDLDALNRRWGASLGDFAEARAVRGLPPGNDVRYLARYYDFLDFRFDYINSAVAWFCGEYRKHGIDVPLLHNTYDILSVQDARTLLDGVVDVIGTDAYPPNEFERVVSTGESISHQRFLEFFRYYGTLSDTNFLAEFQSGIGHGLHYYSGVLTPNHYRLAVLSALLAGVNSWNWYMLANRDNWMMSPINEWGRRQREVFNVFKELVSLYRQVDVPSLRRLTNTGATFYLRHQVMPAIEHDPTLAALYEAGIDFTFFDVERGKPAPEVLFYTGDDWLPRDCQQRLLEFAEDGGHLVFFQRYPIRDESFATWNGLGLAEPDGALNEPFLDHLATEVEVDIGGEAVRTRAPLFTWSGPPGDPIVGVRVDADIRDSDFEENRYLRSLIIGRRYVVGYRESRGAGSVTLLGIHPSAEAVIAVHRMLGVGIPVLPGGGAIQAAAFERGRRRYVIVVNAGKERVDARLDLGANVLGGPGIPARNMRAGIRVERTGNAGASLYVDLPAKDGTIIELGGDQD